jgi:hypothetical protein
VTADGGGEAAPGMQLRVSHEDRDRVVEQLRVAASDIAAPLGGQ